MIVMSALALAIAIERHLVYQHINLADFLDQDVTDTIIKLSPFPKPPVKAELIMPITYRLN